MPRENSKTGWRLIRPPCAPGVAGPLRLAPSAAARMRDARSGALKALASGQHVYGWNQALGPLKDHALTEAQQRDFQRRILRSHAAGTGSELPAGVARLALVLLANAMARAHMGGGPRWWNGCWLWSTPG